MKKYFTHILWGIISKNGDFKVLSEIPEIPQKIKFVQDMKTKSIYYILLTQIDMQAPFADWLVFYVDMYLENITCVFHCDRI